MLTTDNFKIKQYSETPLDDLLLEYSESREEFQAPDPKPVTPETSPDDGPKAPDPSANTADDPSGVPQRTAAEQAKELKGKRQFTAKFLAKNTDRAFAFINALIADSDDVDEWKAEPDDVKDIEECYLEMCQSYGWSGLPPWLSLIMCLLFTYGPAAKEAYKVRGVNKELAAKAARAEADRLIAQAEADRLKKEKSVRQDHDLAPGQNLDPGSNTDSADPDPDSPR